MKRYHLFAIPLFAVAGCGRLPGVPSLGSAQSNVAALGSSDGAAPLASATPTASNDTAAGAVAGAMPVAKGTAAKFYQAWSYKDAVAAAEDRKQAWELVAGKATMQAFGGDANPDPALIKTWGPDDNGTSAIRKASIVLQAAAVRTWTQDCQAEYKKHAAFEQALAGKYGADLAKLAKEPNWHVAMRGFAALAQQVRADRKEAGFATPNDRGQALHNEVGMLWQIAAAAAAYHNAKRPFLEESHVQPYLAAFDLKALREGRPVSSDAAFEQQSYCASAAQDGSGRMPALPVSGDSVTTDAIQWPLFTTAATRRVLATQETKLRASAAEQLTFKTDGGWPGLRRDTPVAYKGASKLVVMSDLVVRQTAPNLVFEQTERKLINYDCRRGRLTGIDDNGNLKYEENCKSAPETFSLTIEAKRAELPAGYVPAKGDVVSFYALVEADAIKETKKGKGRDVTRKVTVDVQHMYSAERKQAELLKP